MAERRGTEMAVRMEGQPERPATQMTRPLVPPVDVYENDHGITLLADMPGVTKEGLDVQVNKNVLTIKGVIADMVPEDIKPLYAEFGGKEYERAFTLGPDVDITRIEASMSSGVLKLFIPKAEEVKPKRIEVKVEQ